MSESKQGQPLPGHKKLSPVAEDPSAKYIGGTGGGAGAGPIRIPFPGGEPTPVRGASSRRAVVLRLTIGAKGADLETIASEASKVGPQHRPWSVDTARDGVRALCRDRGFGAYQEKADGPVFLLHPDRPTMGTKSA